MLRNLMPHATPLFPAPAAPSGLGRALAAAQMTKETWSALLLVLPLLLSRPWFFLTTLPGLVLYALHGALALGRLRRRAAGLVWGLTLIEEVWTWLAREMAGGSPARQYFGRVAFGIGLFLSLAALTELAWRWQRRQRAGHPHGRPAGRRA